MRRILRAKSTSHGRLTDVFSARPESVWVAHNGVESQVPFDALKPGDIVVVHAGEVIPVDGTVAEGAASVDQHLLTGEGQPVDRGPGEPVLAATLVCAGRNGVRVETADEATIAASIDRLLEHTRGYSGTLVLGGGVSPIGWAHCLVAAVSLPQETVQPRWSPGGALRRRCSRQHPETRAPAPRATSVSPAVGR